MRIRFDTHTFQVLMIASKKFSEDPRTALYESRKIVSEIAKDFEKKHIAKSVSLQYMAPINGQKHFAVTLSAFQLLAFDAILRFWTANNDIDPQYRLHELHQQINQACLNI